MKKALIFIFSMCLTSTLMAQTDYTDIEIGMELTLGPVSASGYQHIDLPRKNFIIKRGAIADYNNLEGRKVVVTDILTTNGRTEVVLKRKDGLKFFRFWPSIHSDAEKALANGELRVL
jgi:hypothetical protein